MTKPITKKPIIKIGNAQPKNKLEQFKTQLATSDSVENEVVQPVEEEEIVYLPPAMVRKAAPPPAKKNVTATGKLDFSTITLPGEVEVQPIFDAARYLKK